MSLRLAGGDVAFTHDFFTVAVGQYHDDVTDPHWRLIYLDQWNRTEWNESKRRIALIRSKIRPRKWYMDGTNNEAVIAEMKNLHCNVEGLHFNAGNKYDMNNKLTKNLAKRKLRLAKIGGEFYQKSSPRQKALLDELWRQIREQEMDRESATPKMRHPENRHDDLFWAVALLNYSIEQVKATKLSIKQTSPFA